MGNESSADAWNIIEKPSKPPPPIPTTNGRSSEPGDNQSVLNVAVIPPTPQFSKLSLDEPSTNPWQPSSNTEPLPVHDEVPELNRHDSGGDAWATVPPPSRPPPVMPPTDSDALIDFDSGDESPAWDEEEDDEPALHDLPVAQIPQLDEVHKEQNAWEAAEAQRRKDYSALAEGRVMQAEQMRQEEGWGNENGLHPQQSGLTTADGIPNITATEPRLPPRPDSNEGRPALPQRPEEPPLQPPRPFTEHQQRSDSSLGSAAKKQRKETYEIRKIRWHDESASQNPRTSPILVQNVNGPCPLLALVNALTLSTPAELQTPLVEALRSREQISLLLLLDAVIDELMSGRRGGAEQELPDVIDLHYFLLDLHTGMNVNPRFLPKGTDGMLPRNAFESHVDSNPGLRSDPRHSLTHIHPAQREDSIPGTFEETHETTLYNAFSIPLIHGWLPPKDSPAYGALQRSAPSYEEVQNLQFREEELEEKMSRQGLSFEEQGLLEDILVVKAFLSESATQLTQYGIEMIQKSMQPGTFAILFRNNHFSTLYRHPSTQQLFSLVTDMGYATHDEVVWESLSDTNGESSELFSGDFRVVGGGLASPRHSTSSLPGPWQTVQGRRRNQSSTSFGTPRSPTAVEAARRPTPPQSHHNEQEDHDLALAIQMQDEEDRIAAEQSERRRREAELTEQYIESQSQTSQNIPVSNGPRGRRHNSTSALGASALRPAIPPRRSNVPSRPHDPEAGSGELPPPSYEQAATEPEYHPPAGSPIHPTATANSSNSALGAGTRRQSSAYASNSASFSTGQTGPGRVLVDRIPSGNGVNGMGRRTASQQGVGTPGPKQEKDCIVM